MNDGKQLFDSFMSSMNDKITSNVEVRNISTREDNKVDNSMDGENNKNKDDQSDECPLANEEVTKKSDESSSANAELNNNDRDDDSDDSSSVHEEIVALNEDKPQKKPSKLKLKKK